jgi:hypothetical protein
LKILATKKCALNRVKEVLYYLDFRPNFDDTKYFSYGCHCLIRGDQLDHHGTGEPVDALDSVCRKYKNCQKCVQFEYGKTCTDEAAYKIRYSSSGAIRARDRLATCEREVFNCDHQFAIDLAEELDVYDQGFHTFMGPFDYNGNIIKSNKCSLFIFRPGELLENPVEDHLQSRMLRRRKKERVRKIVKICQKFSKSNFSNPTKAHLLYLIHLEFKNAAPTAPSATSADLRNPFSCQ